MNATMAEPPRGIGIDLNEPVQQPVVEVYLPDPLDWDDMREDLFEFDNHTVFFQENGEGRLSFFYVFFFYFFFELG